MVNLNDQIGNSVSCFSFNKDFKQIALSPKDSSIIIYELPSVTTEPGKWTKKHVLEKHESLVSSIDWSPASNMIVSCGHDRNAYVWNYNKDNNKWEPTLVILRINRAANSVLWAPNGAKFAVGSSSKVVPVCRYEKSNNWWVSKMIKKHRSTILSVAWHPNNIFVLTGCCDNKCRIFSGFIDKLDQMEDEAKYSAKFPDQMKFGALLAEIDVSKCWVESVCWSLNGNEGAFASHDPAITFFSLEGGEKNKVVAQRIELETLPFRAVQFLDDTHCIAAGHDNNPFLYVKSGNEWKFKEKVDKEASGAGEKKVSGFAASQAMWQKSTTRGSFDANAVFLKTRHQNQIVEIQVISKSGKEFFTGGLDGRIIYWKL